MTLLLFVASCAPRFEAPEGAVAERGASSAQAIDGELYTRTSYAGKTARYEVIQRIDRDTPELVLELAPDVHVSGLKHHAAMLIETFTDAGTHHVSIYDPRRRKLEVVPEPVHVEAPQLGWFGTSGGGWGFVDENGLHDRARVIHRSNSYVLGASAEGWVDWADRPARIHRRDGVTLEADGDVAAFAIDGDDVAWLEVFGPNTLYGDYERAIVRWRAGSVELELKGTTQLELEDRGHITLTNGGSFYRIDRATKAVERFDPPPGKAWQLRAAARGRSVVQELDPRHPATFDRWLTFSSGS